MIIKSPQIVKELALILDEPAKDVSIKMEKLMFLLYKDLYGQQVVVVENFGIFFSRLKKAAGFVAGTGLTNINPTLKAVPKIREFLATNKQLILKILAAKSQLMENLLIIKPRPQIFKNITSTNS